MKSRTHNIIIYAITAVLTVFLISYYFEASTYLWSSAEERLDLNEDQDVFGPSGFKGHGLGFLAALFMLFLWLYIIRKRWNRLRGMGKLSQWLKYHMWFGIAAPLLATFHAAFRFEGLIGVMYWAMIAVMLSGIVGRYLYGHIPRRRDGHALTQAQMDTEKASRLRSLQMEFGISAEDISALSTPDMPGQKQGILSALIDLLLFDIRKRSRINKMLAPLKAKYGMVQQDLEFLRSTIEQQVVIAQRIKVLDSVSKVFHWWHVIHKPFAYAIFLVLLGHIILTMSFGFTWIF